MAPEIVVCNAGPLITLTKIGRLHLLQDLFGQIRIPQAVYEEVALRGTGRVGAIETREANWIVTQSAGDRLSVALLREDLGMGESEAIVLAQEVDAAWLLLDDALARRKASRIGIPVVGTLGVLLMAKSAGLIDAVKPALDDLRKTDFRVSPMVLDEVLNKAGESVST
ncbi:MAG TPA: DUF3368 domain-containing protein [Anaerolineae bacterium]|nr:DUF3368 domain-containing protein [Anaerolineae bacterium]